MTASTAAMPARGVTHPAVFLDKDGTLIENLPFNVDPARVRFAPGAAEALTLFGQLGWPVVVVSNQPGVALGRFESVALEVLGRRLAAMCAARGARLAAFAWCPHAPAADGSPACACRKPEPGLLLDAAARHGIDRAASWMVGDILDDIEAGRRAGLRTVLVDNGGETVWRDAPLRRPHHRVTDLHQAALVIARAVRAPRRDWPR
ncbi:D-glycero-alpha-D-manno-heptose-1,7-bisphosphate 7-phosphatase [Derxia gummosa]|uniref:D,D-heptose 1,7-bisphosphate phosphatase n=1 Tax=Derxia gummosa DSM 723 TaxID=1121388 RepID=A0A9U5CUC4_9BURK|nr:HAD family hydrolase [Derxia gummosa]